MAFHFNRFGYAAVSILGGAAVLQAARAQARQESSSSPAPQKLWVDCDPGPDDAHALAMALCAPGVDVVGVSGVFGNMDLSKVMLNIAIVAKLGGASHVPQYAGAEKALAAEQPPHEMFKAQAGWCGADGLNNKAEHLQRDLGGVQPSFRVGEAAAKLKEATEQHPGELIVVALGPLTNIATAIKENPELPSKWRKLVVMGGTTDPTRSQFNFGGDVAAAETVLAAFHGKTDVLCPLPASASDAGSGPPDASSSISSSISSSKGELAKLVGAAKGPADTQSTPGRLLLVTREDVHSHKVPKDAVYQWGDYQKHGKQLVDFIRTMWSISEAPDKDQTQAPDKDQTQAPDKDQTQAPDKAVLNDVLVVAIALKADQLHVGVRPADVRLQPNKKGHHVILSATGVRIDKTEADSPCLDMDALQKWLQQ